MGEPEDRPGPVGVALRDLRLAVRENLRQPASAVLRARADRRARNRRGAAAAVAVFATVAAIAAVLVRTAPSDPAPPAQTPTVLSSPPGSPSAAPSGSGVVSRPVRPVPSRPAPPNDPIARVNWAAATITVPVHPEAAAGCPSGRLRFQNGHTSGWPRIVFNGSGSGKVYVSYGDVNGDGRLDAVLNGSCLLDAEDSGDGAGQLLVVGRAADGSLNALGWAGPRGSVFLEFWVNDGRLYTDARPHVQPWEYRLGTALAFRWRNGRFEAVDSGYLSLQPAARASGPAALGPEIDLGPDTGAVATALGCPGGRIRISDDPGGEVVARNRGFAYGFPSPMNDQSPHLMDLAGDGHRHVVVSVQCYRGEPTAGNPAGQGVLVLDRVGAGFGAVDLVPVARESGFSWEIEAGRLTVDRYDGAGNPIGKQVWNWNGLYFQPA